MVGFEAVDVGREWGGGWSMTRSYGRGKWRWRAEEAGGCCFYFQVGMAAFFPFISLPTSLSEIGSRTDYAAGLVGSDLWFNMQGMDGRVRENSRNCA